MISNIWHSTALKGVIDKEIGKTRDRIPAICNGEEGIALVSLKEKEVKEILHLASRNIVITPNNTAKIQGTSIVIDVISIKAI